MFGGEDVRILEYDGVQRGAHTSAFYRRFLWKNKVRLGEPGVAGSSKVANMV